MMDHADLLAALQLISPVLHLLVVLLIQRLESLRLVLDQQVTLFILHTYVTSSRL